MASRLSIVRAGRAFSSLAAQCPRTQLRRSFTRPQQLYALNRRRAFSSTVQAREKRYTETHEWVELAADGNICTLGISSYAANALGDVVYVELPELDLEVGFDDAIGGVESTKSASDIMTPVTGKVVEANQKLQDTPSLLNKDPEGEGWIAKIECKHPEEVEKLMDAEKYRRHTEEEEGH